MTDKPTPVEQCRFCQSQAVRSAYIRVSDDCQWWHVECANCFSTGPHRTTEVDAIADWNHRIETLSQQEELPDDVRRLVIAARIAAAAAHVATVEIDELDKAAEAFASRVPWENEDD